MLRIGFILPTSRRNYDPFRNQPLIVLYLLTILEEYFARRVELSLIDLRGLEEENLLRHIQESDVFMYSVSTPDFYEISGIIQALRSIYPKAKHIAGGPHINLFPHDSAKLFDAIALGEGEESITRIVDDIFSSDLKPIYKQEEPIDVDSYPYPSRKYLSKEIVTNTGLLGGKYLNLRGTTAIFSRGCPFNCHFCPNKELTFGPVRYRSPELVEEEIEYLKREYQIEALAIKDDNSIPLDKKIARPFLEAIGRTGVKWRGQSRANGVHPDMVQLAWDTGCVDIAIGIESVSPRVLGLINKQIDLDKAKAYIKLLNKTGISVRLHFIIGLPGESDDVVEKTLAFIDETNPSSVLLCLFCPMPGCEIYRHPERFGIRLETTDWTKYQSIFARFNPTEAPTIVFKYDKVMPWGMGMSKEKILENYVKIQSVLRERNLNF